MAEQKNQNEHLNVEDALTQSEAFLIKYKNAIIGGVVAVIIIVAGFIMYKNLYAEPREEKAQAALFKGQEYFEQDAFEQALNGYSIGYTGFLKVADDYSGTKALNLAKAYAGICYAQLGQLDKAASTLLSAADKADNNTLSPIFLIQAGEILVKQGKYDDAVNAYTKIKDKYFQSYQAMDIDKYIEQAKLMKK